MRRSRSWKHERCCCWPIAMCQLGRELDISSEMSTWVASVLRWSTDPALVAGMCFGAVFCLLLCPGAIGMPRVGMTSTRVARRGHAHSGNPSNRSTLPAGIASAPVQPSVRQLLKAGRGTGRFKSHGADASSACRPGIAPIHRGPSYHLETSVPATYTSRVMISWGRSVNSTLPDQGCRETSMRPQHGSTIGTPETREP